MVLHKVGYFEGSQVVLRGAIRPLRWVKPYSIRQKNPTFMANHEPPK